MAYVYRHIRLDKNEPFYIGIGNTPYRHVTKQGRNIIWHRIAKKTEYEVEIIFDDVSWEFAKLKEAEFIKLYGRINNNTGVLSNMNDGGDGNLGLTHSEFSRKKIAAASKGRPGYWKDKVMSKEFREKLSKTKTGIPNYKLRGKKCAEITRQAVIKHSIGNKYHFGKKHTEESKFKMSENMKGRPSWNKGKKWPSNIPHTCIGRKYNQETIKKMSLAQKWRPVYKCGIYGDVICEYPSIAIAAKENDFFSTGIQAACKGRFNSYKGYIWKYK